MVCKLRSGRRPLEIGFHLILAVPSFSNGKFHQLLLGDQDLQLIHECVLYMCMASCMVKSFQRSKHVSIHHQKLKDKCVVHVDPLGNWLG